MRNTATALAAVFTISVATLLASTSARASSQLQTAAIISTIAESSLATQTSIQDRVREEIRELSWSATYSDPNWVLTETGMARGREVHLRVSGFLWREANHDWLIAYSGFGRIGDETIQVNGKSDWLYDPAARGHTKMNFRQVIKFGKDPFWGWVAGAESIVGGTLVGGGAIATVTVATGGIGLPAAIWIGAGGAVTGSAALVGASAAVKSMTDPNRPPPAPPLPKRPTPPRGTETLRPTRGRIYTVVSKAGRVWGTSMDGLHVLFGRFRDGKGRGTIVFGK